MTITIVAALLGCDDRSKQKSPGTSTVVFHTADGRTLTADELSGLSGSVKFEIIGTDDVSAVAKDLHEPARQAGERGDYPKTIELLTQASSAAPKWPYPVYDMAYTYLLMNDPEKARTFYRKTLNLSPRGFFTAITALDTLEREQKGQLPPGLYLAYLSLESMNRSERLNIARQLTAKQPNFAPGWKEFAFLLDDDEQRLKAIESGLEAKPDEETKGMLLINKALVIDRRGEHDEAVRILGYLALDPQSTLANERLAKMTLGSLLKKK